MNEYKITYSVNGKTYTTNRVEHTEATAKRAFLKGCKEMDTTAEVLSLELIRCATKQQERDALEAIRKMIAELGPQSYLATAFEGCFEDAECNIENDFGDSWKRRCESAERKLDEAKAEAQAKIATLEAELRKAQQGIDELVQKDDERKDAIKRMQAKALSSDDLFDIRLILEARIKEDEDEAKRASAGIVKYADDPNGEEFLEARNAYHIAQHDAEVIRELLGRVMSAQSTDQSQAA